MYGDESSWTRKIKFRWWPGSTSVKRKATALLAFVSGHSIAARGWAGATIVHLNRANLPLALAIRSSAHRLARLEVRSVLGYKTPLGARRVLESARDSDTAVPGSSAPLFARGECRALLSTPHTLTRHLRQCCSAVGAGQRYHR